MSAAKFCALFLLGFWFLICNDFEQRFRADYFAFFAFLAVAGSVVAEASEAFGVSRTLTLIAVGLVVASLAALRWPLKVKDF